jgi:hypothetical protein
MIVAIEGASAAGKTTWCRLHCPDVCVPETPENIAAPDLYDDPAVVARFWVEHACANWQYALAVEREHGLAVCDGDPFHLYFAWALRQVGELDGRLFTIERELYRSALLQQRIGLVDRVFWLEVEAEELRRRAADDHSRRRKRHELYLRLVPWMKAWYAVREELAPSSVRPLDTDLCIEELKASVSVDRYNLALFDRWIAAAECATVAHLSG